MVRRQNVRRVFLDNVILGHGCLFCGQQAREFVAAKKRVFAFAAGTWKGSSCDVSVD